MKLKITFIFFTFLCLDLLGQTHFIPKGEGSSLFNESQFPCLTHLERNTIKTLLNENIELLKSQNNLFSNNNQNRGNHPLFIWPVQQATGFSYNNTWAVSGYVDHNTGYPNQLTDYNCGNRSYDTSAGYNHQGLDIYLWPFSWKQMDDGQTEIIAAAPGQIIAKGDGQYDRSCSFNNNPWNAVYIQHSDGSIAWYGHMKNGSVTTKNVGEMVALGEVLGVVGSSGNSTGPHLHFEVYTDDSFAQLIDPFAGSCNSLNGNDTWWETQNPYNNSGINAMLTHNAAPDIFPPCPTTETPNISNNFETDDTIYFAAYFRDQVAGETINFKVIKPDNSFLYNWDINASETSSSWYYYWYFTGVYDQEGEWKWQATYGGETVTHTFNIGTLSVEEHVNAGVMIYPNPVQNELTLKNVENIQTATIHDITGKQINSWLLTGNDQHAIDLSGISKGLYFLSLEGKNKKEVIKFIKK